MADASGRQGARIAATIILVFALINLAFLLTELTVNVFGAMLPL